MAKNSDRFDNSEGEHIRATQSVRLVLTGQSAGATATFDVDALAATQGQRAIPAGSKIIGQYIEVEEAITFDGTTTGVSLVSGVTGTTNAFILTGAIAALAAAAKSDVGGPGTGIGRVRNTAPALEAVITATGGATDVAEIDAGVIWLHTEYVILKGRVTQS